MIKQEKLEKRRRLKPEERKKEILKAAKKVFLEKGYKNCSIVDIISESGLSSGGFYHYYKEKSELLHDIMKEGNQYRFEQMMKFAQSHPDSSAQEVQIEAVLGKILDENEMKDIYILFLQEIHEDESLKQLYEKMMEGFRRDFSVYCEQQNLSILSKLNSDLFIGILNSLYLGMGMLNLRPVFEREKETIKKMLLALSQEDI